MERYTGYLRAVLEKKQDKTCIKDCYFQGAFKITRSVYLDDTGQACLYVMNPGGGYVAGDMYKQELILERGAEVIITTQSSTKVYKTENLPAVLETEIILKADSLLEYLPDPTIAYQNARYQQKTVVRMERGAALIYADMLTPGWAEDGTLFRYDLIQSKLEVYMEDQLVLLDHLKLEPDEEFQGMGSMEGYTHFGSLIVISERVTTDVVEQLYELVPSLDVAVKMGMSMLAVPGFAVRILAHSTQDIEKVIGLIHSHIRESWFQRKSVFLRKY